MLSCLHGIFQRSPDVVAGEKFNCAEIAMWKSTLVVDEWTWAGLVCDLISSLKFRPSNPWVFSHSLWYIAQIMPSHLSDAMEVYVLYASCNKTTTDETDMNFLKNVQMSECIHKWYAMKYVSKMKKNIKNKQVEWHHNGKQTIIKILFPNVHSV